MTAAEVLLSVVIFSEHPVSEPHEHEPFFTTEMCLYKLERNLKKLCKIGKFIHF